MLDQVDRDVLAWAESLAGEGGVRLGLPGDEASARGLYLHLFEVRQNTQQHAAGQSIWRFAARYLVVAAAADARESHGVLGAALVKAMESDQFEVDAGAPSLELWQALRIAPRPAFVLSVPCRHERQVARRPLVRAPLTVQWGAGQPLSGSVVGASDLPIMLASVEIPEIGVSTSTDWHGRFRFPSVPDSAALLLQVSAKGKRVRTSLGDATDAGGNVVIRMDVGA